MASKQLQPLVSNQSIVNADGTPTQYFIRWAQQRQIDIQGSISGAQAAELIAQALADFSVEREIIAGVGLDGGGPLTSDVTIDLGDTLVTPGTYGDATNVPRLVIDAQGRVQAATQVPVSGGGGGGQYPLKPPVITDLPNIAGNGNAAFASLINLYRNGITMHGTFTSGRTGRFFSQPVSPTTAWRFRTRCFVNTNPDDFWVLGAGIGNNAADERIMGLGRYFSPNIMSLFNWNGFAGNMIALPAGTASNEWPGLPQATSSFWTEIEYNGAGLTIFRFSSDGWSWGEIYRCNVITTGTMPQGIGRVGLVAYSTASSGGHYLQCSHFEVVAPDAAYPAYPV